MLFFDCSPQPGGFDLVGSDTAVFQGLAVGFDH